MTIGEEFQNSEIKVAEKNTSATLNYNALNTAKVLLLFLFYESIANQ